MLRHIILALMVFVIGIGLGVTWATYDAGVQEMVRTKKRELREFSGLPKLWKTPANPTDDHGRMAVKCPSPSTTLFLLTGGQSNAANTSSAPKVVLTESDHVFDFFNGKCYVSTDPVLGATGKDSSLWPSLGRDLSKIVDQNILFVHGAIGGTQAADWLDSRSNYYDAFMNRVNSARAVGYQPKLLLWHQGETDAAAAKSIDEVVSDYSALTDKFIADIPSAILYLFRASRCVGENRTDGAAPVTSGQARVAERNSNILLGMNTDVLDDDFRRDGCHFNSKGREHIIRQLLIDLPKHFSSVSTE